MTPEIERLAKEADDYADAQTQSLGEFHPNWHEIRDAKFVALIAEQIDAAIRAKFPEPALVIKAGEAG